MQPLSPCYSLPNIAPRWLPRASAEERHIQRSSGAFYPHVMSLFAERVQTWRAMTFLFHQSPRTLAARKALVLPFALVVGWVGFNPLKFSLLAQLECI